MLDGKRVVAWIPFGRELTVSILLPYLVRDHEEGIVDELVLYLNTEKTSDLMYAEELTTTHDWITAKERPGPKSPKTWKIPPEWRKGFRQPVQLNTGRAPWFFQDRGTVYVRLDDDVVWIHPEAIRRIAKAVLVRRHDTLGVFPLIYNNAICSWFLQQHGRIPREWGVVGGRNIPSEHVSAVDPVGWRDPTFAERLHGYVLDHLESGSEDDLLVPAELTLGRRQQFSVSCFGISGEEYADVGGILDWDEEEHWLTCHRTGIARKSNLVHGPAAVSHFSFYTQRDYLLARTNLLERYAKVAAAL